MRTPSPTTPAILSGSLAAWGVDLALGGRWLAGGVLLAVSACLALVAVGREREIRR